MSEINEMMNENLDCHKVEKLKRYDILNQFVLKGETLFVGSSLMEQFSINEFQQILDKKHIIYNRGVSGFVTNELLSFMDTCIFDLSPSKLFINIGTNDVGLADYQQENLITNYNHILKEIKKRLPKCTVYVMAYYPVNQNAYNPSENDVATEVKFKTRTNSTLIAANIAIKELSKRYDYEFINVNAGLVDKEGNLKKEYTIEGIHLWPSAYFCIFNNLKKYL